jgi:YebC/PmpR family DNA-binding regulatory protein
MAGHSKWANIKRTKEAQDKKRASTFTKLSQEITLAAKLGDSGEVGTNAMLKMAVDKAKAANMPNDKIQRAINRGMGITEGDDVVLQNTYEFYGPNGTAMLVDCETDNANRTLTDLKTLATRLGLKMANEGSISWQFEEKGYIELELKEGDIEEVMLGLLEIEGIEDLHEEDGLVYIYTDRQFLKIVLDRIREMFGAKCDVKAAKTIKVTDTTVDVKGHEEQLEKIEESVESLDDVANIWTNYTL